MNIPRFSLCLALAVLSITPALAHRAASPLAPPSAPSAAPTEADIANPCELSSRFIALHTEIIRLDHEAVDTGNEALRLNHTSMSRPYRDIERKWADVAHRSWPIVQKLYDIPLDLDDLPGTPQKRVALELNTAYQTSLKQVMDYTRSAVYYEHAENMVSTYVPAFLPTTFAFGINSLPQILSATQARTFFEWKTTEPVDAIGTLNFPEYLYAKTCHMTFPTVK